MKILALDFGLKRIGIAVGSFASGIAFPREVLLNSPSLYDELRRVLDSEGIEQILLGIPIMKDATDSDFVENVRQFEETLKKKFHLPVIRIDERLTSKIAAQKLRSSGIPAHQQKSISDSVAAQIMLQEFLDRS